MKKKSGYLIFLLFLTFACGNLQGEQASTNIKIKVDGLTRTAEIHLPAAYDKSRPLPLVILFHGSRGDGKSLMGTGFNEISDKYNCIAVYPDGIAGDHTWNSLFGRIPEGEGVLSDKVDDIAFTRGLIKELSASYRIDALKIYVCGISAGGYMAARAAVELSDIIAAAGIVCGSLGIKSQNGKPASLAIPDPLAPVSVIQICGMKDNIVNFAGAQTPKNLFKSAEDCIKYFVKANNCSESPVETKDSARGLTRRIYSNGRNSTEVKLVLVNAAGHTWPTLKNHGISANEELWNFFYKHPKKAD